MKKRKRASDFTDIEKDELIERCVLEIPPRGIAAVGLPVDLQRKLMQIKLDRATTAKEIAEIGIACTNDLNWFLGQHNDAHGLSVLGCYFLKQSDAYSFNCILAHVETFTLNFLAILETIMWREYVFHPKIRLTTTAWHEVFHPAQFAHLDVTIVELFEKIDFSAQVEFDDDEIGDIFDDIGDCPYSYELAVLFKLHYPSVMREFQMMKPVETSFLKTYFKAFPRTLQQEIKTFKLVCHRLRKTISKDVEQLIVKEIVKKHVML